MMRLTSFCRDNAHALSIVFIGNLSLVVHLFIFKLHGPDPFGYDVGFYRRYLIEPVSSFPNTPVPGLGDDALVPRILFDILRATHLSPEAILYGSYVAFFIIIPILIYVLLVPTIGKLGALLAGLFIVLSPVQYVAYWFMLWKNAWALSLLLFACIALERRWLMLLIATEALLALSHKTTAIMYLLTLSLLLVWKRRADLLLHIAIVGSLLALVAYTPLQKAVTVATPVGLFIDWQEFLWLSLPFLLAILVANVHMRHIRLPASVLAFLCVVVAYPLLHLPFYERVFLFSDIALAILAAGAVSYMMKEIANTEDVRRVFFYGAALCIFVGFIVGSLLNEIHTRIPFLAENSISRIAELGSLVPPDATILTSANEAPWFEGWTLAHIAAPGMLRDTHSLEEWQALWASTSTAEKIRFLGDFDHPLYIATLDNLTFLIGTPPQCLTAITPELLRDDCVHAQ